MVIRDTAIASIGSKTEEDRAAIAGIRAEEEITAAKNVSVERMFIATAVPNIIQQVKYIHLFLFFLMNIAGVLVATVLTS